MNTLLGDTQAWKAVAAVLSAFLTSLVAEQVVTGPWAGLAVSVVAGLAVFLTPNPTRNSSPSNGLQPPPEF